MYNTLLSPDFVLERDAEDEAERAAQEALWDRFDGQSVCRRVRGGVKPIESRSGRAALCMPHDNRTPRLTPYVDRGVK